MLDESFRPQSIEAQRKGRRTSGYHVREICVFADAEGGSISVLPDSGAQWPYKVSCARLNALKRSGYKQIWQCATVSLVEPGIGGIKKLQTLKLIKFHIDLSLPGHILQ